MSAWLFLAGALVSAALFIYAYRQNNLTMIQLRDRVAQVDFNDGDIEGALRDLREHVHSHMNTDLTPTEDSIHPPIQLKYEYERLVQAERDRVARINAEVNSQAQSACAGAGNERVNCVAAYVSQHGTKERPIPDDLYKFDFVSPRWSPDVAGWSLIMAILLSGLFVTRLILDYWFRYELERHS